MPAMRPTTTLVNFYKENASFKWHRDSEDPELQRTNKAPPIVSFTVGLSAEFAYKRRFEDAEHASVRLDSGDAFLFGGPARMIAHSVLRVLPNTTPGAPRAHAAQREAQRHRPGHRAGGDRRERVPGVQGDVRGGGESGPRVTETENGAKSVKRAYA